jgi:hypothetical protein
MGSKTCALSCRWSVAGGRANRDAGTGGRGGKCPSTTYAHRRACKGARRSDRRRPIFGRRPFRFALQCSLRCCRASRGSRRATGGVGAPLHSRRRGLSGHFHARACLGVRERESHSLVCDGRPVRGPPVGQFRLPSGRIASARAAAWPCPALCCAACSGVVVPWCHAHRAARGLDQGASGADLR